MQGFDIDAFLAKYRYFILITLIGLIFVTGGFLVFKKSLNFSGTEVTVLNTSDGTENGGEITVEISGAVINPGVYKLKTGERINDLLIISGGFSADADRSWTDKFLNRAATVSDGQKVYIPYTNQQSNVLSANSNDMYQSGSSTIQSDSNNFVNINTATLNELDSLPGIGPKYGQKIIDHRPYSKPEDLLEQGIITQTLYEKIKDAITVY